MVRCANHSIPLSDVDQKTWYTMAWCGSAIMVYHCLMWISKYDIPWPDVEQQIWYTMAWCGSAIMIYHDLIWMSNYGIPWSNVDQQLWYTMAWCGTAIMIYHGLIWINNYDMFSSGSGNIWEMQDGYFNCWWQYEWRLVETELSLLITIALQLVMLKHIGKCVVQVC